MTAPLPIVRTVADLRAEVSAWRRDGLRVAFVPTMGALHEGHLDLVRVGRERADRVIASVFVNPLQFAAHEDLGAYPRREADDARALAAAGCGLMFAPDPGAMYPPGFATRVVVDGPSEGLETDHRPHFFGGVATVVAKLLNQVQADVAVFGEKDYQQLLVVKRLAADLDVPTEIVAAPTRRDEHGLALSSRNAYLSEAEAATARRLNLVLADVVARVRAGAPAAEAEAAGREALAAAGFAPIDYVAVRRADDLRPFSDGADAPARVLAAAWLGKTRLIDNMAV
jgi:pantoate--beta-alanine ligase